MMILYAANDPETSQVTKLVLEMLALNDMPYNFVSGVGFSAYWSSLSHGIKRLERSTTVSSIFISAQPNLCHMHCVYLLMSLSNVYVNQKFLAWLK